MLRSPKRKVLTIALITLALSLALAPAEARPLHGIQAAAPADWIATWTDWFAKLFLSSGTPAPEQRTGPSALRTHAADASTGTVFVQPMTGTCIDPNGRIIPCSPI